MGVIIPIPGSGYPMNGNRSKGSGVYLLKDHPREVVNSDLDYPLIRKHFAFS